MQSAGEILELLQALGLSNATLDAIVGWACYEEKPGEVRARLLWAYERAFAGMSLDGLVADDLESAFAFDMAAPTVRMFVEALVRPAA